MSDTTTMTWTDCLTDEERAMATVLEGDPKRDVKLPAQTIQHYLHTIAALRMLVEEKDKALRLAEPLVHGYLLAMGGTHADEIITDTERVLALTEQEMMEGLK